jgi:hypothetical protein
MPLLDIQSLTCPALRWSIRHEGESTHAIGMFLQRGPKLFANFL